MSEKSKNYVIYADEDTHTELSILAARKKVSIKQTLKEIVENNKKFVDENGNYKHLEPVNK